MMIEIDIIPEQIELVKEYSIKQTLNGVSRLRQDDLNKASRLQFQFTGLYGESAWHLYRYGNLNKLKETLDFKNKTLKIQRIGDGGKDDIVTFRGVTRQIDIKTSHSKNYDIKNLNLIVPKAEYHKNTLYISAFTIGFDREKPDKIILAGWAPNEDITKIWRDSEPDKLCVPVYELRRMQVLKKIFE